MGGRGKHNIFSLGGTFCFAKYKFRRRRGWLPYWGFCSKKFEHQSKNFAAVGVGFEGVARRTSGFAPAGARVIRGVGSHHIPRLQNNF